MPFSREGYRKYTTDEKVSAILRSVIQDGCKDFKRETLDVIFKKKEINGVDIGKTCSTWAFRVIGSLDNDNELQVDLLLYLYILYIDGENPDTDEIWHINWLMTACPMFANRIDDFPAPGKAAPLASLDKPDKKGEDFERQW